MQHNNTCTSYMFSVMYIILHCIYNKHVYILVGSNNIISYSRLCTYMYVPLVMNNNHFLQVLHVVEFMYTVRMCVHGIS